MQSYFYGQPSEAYWLEAKGVSGLSSLSHMTSEDTSVTCYANHENSVKTVRHKLKRFEFQRTNFVFFRFAQCARPRQPEPTQTC